MKKFNIITKGIVGACVLMLSLASCNDFLEEKLFDRYAKENYFTNVDMLDMGVLGIYKAMQMNLTYGQSMLGFDNDTDITFINGVGFGSGNAYRDIGHYFYTASQSQFASYWQYMYEGIERANVILENYEQVPANNDSDRAKIRKLVAEARFLRGFYHFELTRFFGAVPLKTTASDLSQDDQLPRTPLNVLYDQITTDISQAAADLPWWNDPGVANDCRVHKGAALGILARVWLTRGGYSLDPQGQMMRPENYREYYQKVLDVTQTILTEGQGKHALNPSYEQIFKNHCLFVSDPSESMFEIDMYHAATQSTQSVTGSWNVVACAEKGTKYNRANSFVKCSKFLQEKFDVSDLRRDVSVGTYEIKTDGSQSQIEVKESQKWSSRKWTREWQESAPQWLDMNYTAVNYVLLRYSDVLLMRAEALNEIDGGAGDGERDKLVNMVRRRGYGLDIYTASSIDMPANLDQNAFLEYLYDERAREFSFESSLRRLDLYRWNKYYDKLQEVNEWCKVNEDVQVNFNLSAAITATGVYYVPCANFIHGVHELYPIPTREMRENKALVQNNGY